MKTLLAAAALLAALPALAQAPQPPLVEDDDYVCPDGLLVELTHDRAAGILRGTRGGETFLLQEVDKGLAADEKLVLSGVAALLGLELDEHTLLTPSEPLEVSAASPDARGRAASHDSDLL